jgi:RHS repeat-associated protein
LDKLGRETKMQTAGFNSQWLTQITTYDAKGNLAAKTNNYYSTETPVTTTNSYDAYNRLLTATNPLGSVAYTYTKLAGGKIQVTTTSAGQSASKITDVTGKVVSAIDNGGQLDFTYDSRGNQTEVKHGGVTLVTSVYDVYGKQTSLTDKNAGTATYSYDAYGQLTQQTDAKSNTYTMVYDDLGRITGRTGPEGTTAYEYYKDIATGCSNNNLTKVTGFNGVLKEYTYDVYKRPATEKVTIDGIAYTTSFTYDQFNAVTKTVYPSGVEENKTYDVTGGLLTVTGGNAGSQVTLFTATSFNGFDQCTGFTLGNGKTSQHTYTYGIPARYYTAGVQDLNMTFDYAKGNLLSRQDVIKNVTENFTFDNLNRLTTATVNGVQQFGISYDGTTSSSMGNITAKTDAGNYVYKTDKIHAVAYITNPAGTQTPPANISTIEQNISYTPFLKAAAITEAPYSLEFTYGPDYQRVKTILKNNSVIQETRLYNGSYEKQIIAGGATREIHYVAGNNGLCAILVKEAGTVTPYYVYTDHLGNLLTITNAAGTVIAEQNFDAWGRKRNPANWQYAGVPATPNWLYRGYTGHEHLPQFALINMNGRIYDPVQGRMLSPDNYVASPFATQGYNRYSYANNNPLKFTDPSGNIVWFAVAAAAIIAGTANGIAYENNGKSFLGGFWRGALVGGGSALTGGLIAGALPGLGGSILGGIASGMINGGLGAALNGGNIQQGLMFGAATGGIGGGFGAYFGGGTGAFIGGAAAGALGAKLNGGDALTGALVGGVSSFAMYHVMNYYNYSKSSLRSELTYGAFSKMSGDIQRSFVRHNEFGGIITSDKRYHRFTASERDWMGINPSGNIAQKFPTAKYLFHVHWARGGINQMINLNGGQATPADLLAGNARIATTTFGPSPDDINAIGSLGVRGLLFDRYNTYIFDSPLVAGNLRLNNIYTINRTYFTGYNYLFTPF